MHSCYSITGINEAIIKNRSVARSAIIREKEEHAKKEKKNVERRILKASREKVNRKKEEKEEERERERKGRKKERKKNETEREIQIQTQT